MLVSSFVSIRTSSEWRVLYVTSTMRALVCLASAAGLNRQPSVAVQNVTTVCSAGIRGATSLRYTGGRFLTHDLILISLSLLSTDSPAYREAHTPQELHTKPPIRAELRAVQCTHCSTLSIYTAHVRGGATCIRFQFCTIIPSEAKLHMCSYRAIHYLTSRTYK